MVQGHAVVASWSHTPKPPEPNDTFQYDIALSIVELTTGDIQNLLLDFAEDDLVHAVSPCGARVCLAGVTGAKSVNTGSTVSYGQGFMLPVSLDGQLGSRIHLSSARHAEVLLMTASADRVTFFATVDGPITHTADVDRWLGYNRAILGIVEGLGR